MFGDLLEIVIAAAVMYLAFFAAIKILISLGHGITPEESEAKFKQLFKKVHHMDYEDWRAGR